MAKKRELKKGDDVTLSKAKDATWFRVEALDGFFMVLREIASDGTLYDNRQPSDTSLIVSHRSN